MKICTFLLTRKVNESTLVRTMRIVVLDPKLFRRRNIMKDFDILCRRVELLEQKVDALEAEIVPNKCSPGEACDPSDECPDSPCCETDDHPTFAGNPDDTPGS